MNNKEKYQNGKDALNKMNEILSDIWRQNALAPFYNESLEWINKKYFEARDAAIIFGEDITRYPRRIRWRTAGLEIIEGVRTL